MTADANFSGSVGTTGADFSGAIWTAKIFACAGESAAERGHKQASGRVHAAVEADSGEVFAGALNEAGF